MHERPWHCRYDEGVPTTLAPYPERTLLDYVSETAREHPQHPAILFKGATLTAGRLERLSNAFAAALVNMGVRKGDRVALLLPNCPQFVIAELGAWKAGAVIAPLNPLYGEEELATLLAKTGAETIVTLTPFYVRVKTVQRQTAVRRVIATSVKEYLPPVLRVLFTLARERREGHRIALEPGDVWLRDLIEAHLEAMRPDVAVTPDDAATLLPSGGTTGTPKSAVGTHHAAVISGEQLAAWLGETYAEGDVMLLPLPLFHIYGLNLVQSIALMRRLPLALIPNPRDIDDVVATIERVRPAYFSGVPSLFNAILHHPRVRAGRADFSSIKLCFSGAAPLLVETKHRFESLTGCRILEGYGMTESQAANTVNPVRGMNKIGSAGLPLPDTDIRIVDTDDARRELPPNGVGEILLHCPQHMRGYWRDPEETCATLRTGDDGRAWIHTGDLGYLDDDGYLFIVDRKKDLIKIGGFQVWPREIEEVIAAHPAVAEVGVAAVPDDERGEIAKAWIVPHPGHQPSADEIRAHCRAHLVPYKVPSAIAFRDELPKTMVGKVLRRKLVESETAETAGVRGEG
ncbi:MAG TPA: AMP-binding protein [Gemmatimonadaceae bacterium]|nr:AMP-binding protein [Gemmatimonadaceae bacterium]